SFISFMLYYMHIATVVTLILSTLVFYLMFTNTAQSGRALRKYMLLLQTLMYFALAFVAAFMIFCFHAKHTAVTDMAKISTVQAALFRGGIIFLVTYPCVIFSFSYTGTGEQARHYIEEFPAYGWIFYADRPLIAYSFSGHMPLLIAVFASVISVRVEILFMLIMHVVHG
ncbi:hypothetical protein PENTCL1PPCAC_20358, partial [Pristionchus entomophagus]